MLTHNCGGRKENQFGLRTVIFINTQFSLAKTKLLGVKICVYVNISKSSHKQLTILALNLAS